MGLVQLGLAEPLVGGSAYHKGSAILTATKNREEAVKAAETYYRGELAKIKMLLPEEKVLHERNIELVKRMVNAQADQYTKDTWEVLKPEVEFLVPLPRTEHHCWYCHKLLHPDIPYDECVYNNLGHMPGKNYTCEQPHFLRGKTDAVLSWNSMIWIMERKTSGMKQNIFWDQWYLSHQLSAYVYGVRKATGLPVNGVILEKSPNLPRIKTLSVSITVPSENRISVPSRISLNSKLRSVLSRAIMNELQRLGSLPFTATPVVHRLQPTL